MGANAIVGGSAGKSTVPRVISGLLKPRLGQVTFGGRSIGGLTPRQVLALGIVQVPQSHSLFPEITVRENVRLGAFTLNDNGLVNRRRAEVEELFPVVRQRARDKAGDLSGGQQRLVKFARCLIHGTGQTILLVEQNVRAGLGISTRGVVMESGQVRLDGTHQEILDNPQISHLYLGGTLTAA